MRIRLACMNCDRMDGDSISRKELRRAIQEGWHNVGRVQTFKQATKTYDDPSKAPPGYSVLDWWTHLGTCPDCS